MTIEVKLAIAHDGTYGYVEENPLHEYARRVFVDANGINGLESKHHSIYSDWIVYGSRARTYGNNFKLSSFILG